MNALQRTFAQDDPPRDASRRRAVGWRLAAAGGEYVGFQLGLRTDAPLAEIEIAPSPLRRRGASRGQAGR